MGTCDHCGNEYDKTFRIRMDESGEEHVFDSIECMAHMVGPRCAHCGCTILGHGIEIGDGRMFCCAHCARSMGVDAAVDRVGEGAEGAGASTRPAGDS
jgi:hypothetical protein